jgi:hypothetical protein
MHSLKTHVVLKSKAPLVPLPQLARLVVNSTRTRQRDTICSLTTNMRQPDQLIQHCLARLLHQHIHVLRRASLCANRRQNRHVDDAGAHAALLHVEDVVVVCADDRDDGDLCLDGEVEGALFEGEEHGVRSVGARAFREDEDGLARGSHGLRGGVEGCAREGAVGAVYEDGFGEGHCGVLALRLHANVLESVRTEPPQKRRPLQTALRRDTTVLGENTP